MVVRIRRRAAHGAQAAGAAALRQCVHKLRHTLGDVEVVIDARRDRISLRRPLTDVFTFEELCASASPESLHRAALLYVGDFCEDFDARNDEVERLLDAERTRIRQLAHRLVARFAASDCDADSLEVGIALARRLVARDPVHEGCARALMTLLDRSGSRAAALGAFEWLGDSLRRELDIEPSAETVSLARRIRADTAQAHAHSKVDEATPGACAPATAPRSIRLETDPAARDQLQRAYMLFRHTTAETNRQARLEAEEAARIDRRYVEALVLVGWTRFFDWLTGWSADPQSSYRLACSQVERALALHAGKASVLRLHANLLLWRWRHDEALEQTRAAVAIAPERCYTHFNLANVLTHCGQHAEALHHVRRALALEADDTGMFGCIEALALFLDGDPSGAKNSLESALARNPNHPWNHALQAAVLSELGICAAGRTAARRAKALAPRWGNGASDLIQPLRLKRDRDRLSSAWARLGESFGGVPRADNDLDSDLDSET